MSADTVEALRKAAQRLRDEGLPEHATTIDRLWQARLWAEKRAACR